VALHPCTIITAALVGVDRVVQILKIGQQRRCPITDLEDA
jgi:hypothetical protein